MKVTTREARVLSGFTKKEVAEKLKISAHRYSKLEKEPKKFTIEQFNVIKQIFNPRFEVDFMNTD